MRGPVHLPDRVFDRLAIARARDWQELYII
jgi:hypothetical protein